MNQEGWKVVCDFAKGTPEARAAFVKQSNLRVKHARCCDLSSALRECFTAIMQEEAARTNIINTCQRCGKRDTLSKVYNAMGGR